jgi:molybdenum cofactor cytidylyltransferase
VKPAGIILAAGLSSRMGRDKALLPYRGANFLQRLIAVLKPRTSPLVVVLGHHAKQIAAVLPPNEGIRIVINADYPLGMLTSLQAGLTVTLPEASFFLFTLVDHPLVQEDTLDELIAAFQSSGQKVVIPRYRGKRGHPVLIAAEVAREILALEPHGSAKEVIQRHRGETCFVDVDDPGVVEDIDLPEHYQALR